MMALVTLKRAGVKHQGDRTLWLQYPVCFGGGLGSHTLQPGQKGSAPCGVSWRGAAAWAWMPAAYAESCYRVRFPARLCWEAALCARAAGLCCRSHLLSAVLARLDFGKRLGTLRCCLLPSSACLPHSVSVLCLEMEYEASLPEKKSNTLSRDLIDYVRYMIQNHGENYKVSTGCPRARSTQSDSGELLILSPGSCFAVS